MQKFKLLRDGQIVGYEISQGEFKKCSYDNQTWTENLDIPSDDKKAFINFDINILTEIYEE